MVREYKKILYVYHRTKFQLHVCNSKIIKLIQNINKIIIKFNLIKK